MTFNLRLPAELDLMARAKSESLGISLNALICVALDEYLKSPNEAPRVSRRPPIMVRRPLPPVVRSSPPPGELSKAHLPGQKLSKAERRAITAQAPLPVKPSPMPATASPERVLSPPGPRASKAERKAYTAQMRLSRKS